MKRKKIILGTLFVIATFFGICSVMWTQKSQEEQVRHITEKMAKKLDLTQEQKEKVYVLNLNRSEGHQKAYEAGRKKEIIIAAVKEWEEGLKQVLNPTQLKKLKIKS
ncbi:hypothetical protein [Costertonia aggregata]|uniref:Uncharacterized protein n=1 Tax=Costertonia aggregata TaxID=343403 RepID=A0A7H9AM22_9FLAO|nr:hypothetical protein [Costertonia aggregata]QLG44457.1 hypothetical protein HYG79_03545 [Costertonia aggregata]